MKSYRIRKREDTLPYSRPRKMTPAIRAEIARRYFNRQGKQMALALEYNVSQSSIARCIAEYIKL